MKEFEYIFAYYYFIICYSLKIKLLFNFILNKNLIKNFSFS